jgi:3'(2'), 5'-bisphosphate nucleotidase
MAPPQPHPYAREEHIALLAVQRAALLTRTVYASSAKGTLSKDDRSPVTVGDFGAQALVISALRHAFPADGVVAEEEAAPLRADARLRAEVWERVRAARLGDDAAEAEIGGPVRSVEDMLAAIDVGAGEGGRGGRVWTLDPIDGTKGFLRGGQYAVALALIVDGQVKVGVIGCPNLPPARGGEELDAGVGAAQSGEGEVGVLLSAVDGRGEVLERRLGAGALLEGRAVRMRDVRAREAVFCEGVEAAHSNHAQQAEIARRLGAARASVRLDSQAKYAAVARGSADIYLRLPAPTAAAGKKYVEKIWDHAAGDLIVREAGGIVTDVNGRRIDFGTGRLLTGNTGLVVAPAGLHAEVLKAVQGVLGIGAAL